jgi:pimeloyl-ACP methyl ester carboxylesterase
MTRPLRLLRPLLLPGLASDAALWRDQIKALRARGYDPVVSDVHSRFASLPEMAAALLAQHPGPLVLVGTSMGGILALEVFRQAPSRVEAMALLGSSARPDTPQTLQLREQAIALFAQGRVEEVLRANVPFAFHPSRAGDPGLVQDYLDMVMRAGADQLIAQNRAIMARPDSRPLLPTIRCPFLMMWGDSDALTPPECGREIVAAIAHAQHEELPACGHLLTWEQPERVNQRLIAWLDALITPPPKHTSPS